MRKQRIKKINEKVDDLLIEWIKTLLDKDEQNKVTKNNMGSMLPAVEYIESKRTFYLSMYTRRWAKQNIKKLLRLGKPLDSISMGDLEWMTKRSMKTGQSNIL
jgi:hypothetical protein